MVRKKMGEILIDNEVISKSELEKALLTQKENSKPIGKILEEMDIVLEEDIAKALATQFGFPYVKKFSRHNFSQNIIDYIDADTALANLIFPLKVEDKTLYLAMSNPLDMALQSDLSFKLGLRISPCVATPEEINSSIKKYYLKDMEIAEKDKCWTILLVDSQEIALSATEAALTKGGYLVYKAKNGAEGIRIATQIKPNLIITDIVMPRMDGIELFKTLKTNRETEHIAVIALSTKTSPQDEYDLLEIGFFDFIAKPINPTRLLARVKRAFKHHGCKH